MSTALLSPSYMDVGDIFYKENDNKGLNLNALDRRAVGTPTATLPRRHSSNNMLALANSAHASLCANTIGGVGGNGGGGGGGGNNNKFSMSALKDSTALMNRENRFRDRSLSEGGDHSAMILAPSGKQHQQQQQTAQTGGGVGMVNSSRYKTELCRPFEENGVCKYGDKCQFAHGGHELRSLVRHPKYKTELCRTFHTIGFCPYGPRCHFIHNADEQRSPTSQQPPLSPSLAGSGPHQQRTRGPRPRLNHSVSFAGFPSAAMARRLDSPPPMGGGPLDNSLSLTPPPLSTGGFFGDDYMMLSSPPMCTNNTPFSFSQELFFSAAMSGAGTGLPLHTGGGGGGGGANIGLGCGGGGGGGLGPLGTPGAARGLSGSPVFEASLDSLSDPGDGYSSSGASSGSESPLLDPNRRLPIFSRLSISDE
ncbi:unnamed protein product [Lampetra planeri]